MSNNFHDTLITTFNDLEKEFQNSLKNAKEQERNFENKLAYFQKNIQQYLQNAQSNLPSSNPMSTPITNFAKSLNEVNTIWQERIKNQDKGTSFRAGFNDSLLVFVFGKVKSGKSSLGNYMAWGNTDPTEDLKKNARHQPKYFSGEKTNFKRGDANKEAELKREFRVGATEATSSIQGFSLPGLTWVDSPGLHSVNEANGKLAEDYVQHADLILYTMKSSAPGRQTDIKEIVKLHAQDKRLLLLITGSDEIEEDEDEDEDGKTISQIVMKEKSTQQKQQAAVRSAMKEVLELKDRSEDIEILSMSARYAQEHPNDIEKFKESGMATLFDTLSHIAKDEGIRLKQKAPLQNFSNYLKSFDKDVAKFERLIKDFENPIKKMESDIPKKVSNATREVERQLNTIIDDEFNKLQAYRDDATKLQSELKKSLGRIQSKRNELLADSQRSILTDVLSDLNKDIIKVAENSAFLQLPEFKIEQTTKKIVASVNSGTRKRNSGIGGMLGAAVGGLIGLGVAGPAGALAGASLGGSIGGGVGHLSGDDASQNFQDVTVKTGDNFYKITQKLSDDINASIESQMQSFERNIIKAALSEVENLTQNIKREIADLKQYFDQQKNQIQNKLNQ